MSDQANGEHGEWPMGSVENSGRALVYVYHP